jgi:hypothetical protein
MCHIAFIFAEYSKKTACMLPLLLTQLLYIQEGEGREKERQKQKLGGGERERERGRDRERDRIFVLHKPLLYFSNNDTVLCDSQASGFSPCSTQPNTIPKTFHLAFEIHCNP